MRNIADLYAPNTDNNMPPQLLLPRRSEVLRQIAARPVRDVVVVGDGIGASIAAYSATLSGLRVVWLIEGDLETEPRPENLVLNAPRRFGDRVRAIENVASLSRVGGALFKVAGDATSGKRQATWTFARRYLKFLDIVARRTTPRSVWVPEQPSLCISYDGTRLKREYLVAARQEGAVVINYVEQPRKSLSGENTTVVFIDSLSKEKVAVSCGAVVDFRPPLNLIRTVDNGSFDQSIASVKLVDGTFRVLANGILAELDAARKVSEILATYSDGRTPRLEPSNRVLPGVWGYDAAARDFLSAAQTEGVRESLYDRVLATWGSRVRFFGFVDRAFEVIDDRILRGEVELAIRTEIAVLPADLERRIEGLKVTDSIEQAFADVQDRLIASMKS